MQDSDNKASIPVRPLIAGLLPFCLGIIVSRYSTILSSSLQEDCFIIPLFSALIVGIIIFPILFIFCRACRSFLSIFLLFLIFFVSGFSHYYLARSLLEKRNEILETMADKDGDHVITAICESAPVVSKDRMTVIMKPLRLHETAGESPLSGRICLVVKGGEQDTLKPGYIYRFKAILKPVRNFNTPGTFDYENWWGLRGIQVKGFVRSQALLIPMGKAKENIFSQLRFSVENLRAALMQKVESGFSNVRNAAVASALLFGSRSGLSPELSDAFSASGTGHLLAVSGLHMAIISTLLFMAVRWLLLRFEWLALRVHVLKIAYFSAILGAVFYAALAGFSPSAIRAMVMITVFALAFIVERPANSLNSLAFAAWILLLCSPLYLFEIAFQLSFTAVLFLILFSPLIKKPFISEKGHRNKKHLAARLLAYMLTLAAVSFIAFVATSPLVSWYFQRFSAAGLLLNLLLIPLVCFFLLPLLLSGALFSSLFPPLSGILWQSADTLISAVTWMVTTTANLKGAWFWVPRPPILHVALVYAVLVFCALLIRPEISRQSKRLITIAAISVCLFIPLDTLLHYHRMDTRTSMTLHVSDVGQGTGQVVELPYGKVMVVDSGGMRSSNFDTGKRIMGPFLRVLGYTHIDFLALSHAEIDHAGGMASLVRDFHPEELWTSDDFATGKQCWDKLVAAIKQTGTRHVVFSSDSERLINSTKIRIFTANGCRVAENRNSRSLVLKISASGGSVLLPGDIDRKREQCLVGKNPGRCNVVVVPHHGSRTSSSLEFIRCFKPEIAVVSAGWRNYLGLPAPDIENRWKEAGARLFVTGRDGTVSVKFQDGIMDVSRYNSPNGEAK